MDEVAARVGEALDAADVGLGHLAVALEREDQRDVDRDAGRDRLLDRGQARAGRRDLDEEVRAGRRARAGAWPPRSCPRVSWARCGSTSSETQPSRAFSPAASHSARRMSQAARMSSTASGEEDLLGLGLGLEDLAELLVVGVALGDRRLEDGRVRGDAVDALVDELLELAVAGRSARERKSIQTLWPCAESWCRGVSGMEPPERGAVGLGGRSEDASEASPVGYPRHSVGNGRAACQRARGAGRARAARRRRPARRGAPRAAGRRGPGSR